MVLATLQQFSTIETRDLRGKLTSLAADLTLVLEVEG
jgi:hypothetical protein